MYNVLWFTMIATSICYILNICYSLREICILTDFQPHFLAFNIAPASAVGSERLKEIAFRNKIVCRYLVVVYGAAIRLACWGATMSSSPTNRRTHFAEQVFLHLVTEGLTSEYKFRTVLCIWILAIQVMMPTVCTGFAAPLTTRKEPCVCSIHESYPGILETLNACIRIGVLTSPTDEYSIKSIGDIHDKPTTHQCTECLLMYDQLHPLRRHPMGTTTHGSNHTEIARQQAICVL